MNLDHVFIDLAVTHPNPRIGQIIGIAAVRTNHKGKPLAAFSEKIKIQTELSSEEIKHIGNYVDSAMTDSFVDVIKSMKAVILDESKYESTYMVVATHAEVDRSFLKNYTEEKTEVFSRKPWLDILALAWPLCFLDMISDRSFDSLCKHFKVENTAVDTATGDCEALVRVYWALIKRYRTALGGEEILREIGGNPLENFRKIVGL